MEFLVNDLSVERQFPDHRAFCAAVERLMKLRTRLRQHGYGLHCHRRLLTINVTTNTTMQQATQAMSRDRQRAWMAWLTKLGPYWEDDRRHDPDAYLAVGEVCVTDTAIGEAAVCVARGLARALVSFSPSNWTHTPIVVTGTQGGGHQPVEINNLWQLDSLERTLADHPQPVNSWTELGRRSRERCARLTFSDDAFAPLRGQPFAAGAAQRITVLLNTLNEMRSYFDNNNNNTDAQTARRNELSRNHFIGDKAWFSDSSTTEKRKFAKELSFSHPDDPAKNLSCPWHGKVKTPQLRIHFSWPISRGQPLYVVYIGPKITRR